MKRLALPAAFSVCLAAGASAQVPAPVVQQGHDVPGIGKVIRIDRVAVGDSGDWIVEAATDFPDTTRNSVLIQNGVVVAREGDPVTAPAGATIFEFDAMNMNGSGNGCRNLHLDGAPGVEQALYFNSKLVVQEGTVSIAPQLSPGSTWYRFWDVKINNQNQALARCEIDDPALPGNRNGMLVVLDLQLDGTLIAENVLYKQGDLLPGQTETLIDFGLNPLKCAFNDAGSVLFQPRFPSAGRAVYLDSLLLAQEGSPSPIPGRPWANLGYSLRTDLNAAGEYVFMGVVTGETTTGWVIVKNGAKFQQLGDSLPAIAPHKLTNFGQSPIRIDDAGNVLWYGEWNDPDPVADAALFLNSTPVVEEGVTVDVDGFAITNLVELVEGYDLSDNGRFLIFEAKRFDGVWAAYLLDLSGKIAPMSECTANLASLAHTGGDAAVGGKVRLSMDSGQAPGVFAFLAFAAQPAPPWPPCGVALPGIGELLIAVSPPNPVLLASGAQPWTADPLSFDQGIPADPTLINAKVYAQGLFADVGGVGSPAEPFRLTGGLEMEIVP